MKIDIIPFADAIQKEMVLGKTVAVVDVLRATSVMVTALSNGARDILPVAEVEEARKASIQYPEALLCGERGGDRIDGFILGNSPLEYLPEVVGGKSLILTTTNGTRAIENCRAAQSVYIGAFLNLDALVNKMSGYDEVVIACAGTRGGFSMDDALCAAFIIEGLRKYTRTQLDDLGNQLMSGFDPQADPVRSLADCFHLKYLVRKGYQEDVRYSLRRNIHPVVPVLHHGIIVRS